MTPDAIATLLEPYLDSASIVANTPPPEWPRIFEQLALYLELILKWNARTNLTAIRSPEEIVRRHFGESLFAGLQLGTCATLMDFGSGAGFPGLPIQLLRPDIQITLAESQGKKAAFLREAVRTLCQSTEVWAARAEAMPEDRRFDTVVLRAVDNMEAAIVAATARASRRMLILGTRGLSLLGLEDRVRVESPIPLPESRDGVLFSVEMI